jgi:hypothetical protein
VPRSITNRLEGKMNHPTMNRIAGMANALRHRLEDRRIAAHPTRIGFGA